MESEIAILDYEHVGIRVSDKRRAQSFYEGMGFRLVGDHPDHEALILTNAAGITINLIYNAVARERNILMDEAEKYPGITHPAFVVSSLDDTMSVLRERGITVTEGPLVVDKRRICFVRDPDGNVLEFDETL